jgi:transcriptional regulator with XRE-family HTH domain
MKTKMKRPARRAVASIPDQLRSLIIARGLSPYSVAVAAGVSPSILARFVAGQRGLNLDTYDLIAKALGLRMVETSGRGRAPLQARPVPAPDRTPDDTDGGIVNAPIP